MASSNTTRRHGGCLSVVDPRFLHDAGDLLLSEVGALLRGNVRKSDVSCRYGGEEFVLVLPDAALADAMLRVDQIRLLRGTLVGARPWASGTVPGLEEYAAQRRRDSAVMCAQDLIEISGVKQPRSCAAAEGIGQFADHSRRKRPFPASRDCLVVSIAPLGQLIPPEELALRP